jgi:hypothetical protein
MPKFEFLLVAHSEAAILQATVERAEKWRGNHSWFPSGPKWRGTGKHMFGEAVLFEE